MFKESNTPHPLFEAGLPSYEREASPSPSEGGDVFPQNASFYLKEPLLHVKRAFLRYEGEPFFTSTRRPLYLQIIVFTPLSIRRGVGGEAFLYLQITVFTPLSIRRGGGGEAVVGRLLGFFLPLNEPYKRLHLRLLYTRQHQFYLPPDRSHTPFSILLSHHPLA